jgi:hypothetical protein
MVTTTGPLAHQDETARNEGDDARSLLELLAAQVAADVRLRLELTVHLAAARLGAAWTLPLGVNCHLSTLHSTPAKTPAARERGAAAAPASRDTQALHTFWRERERSSVGGSAGSTEP